MLNETLSVFLTVSTPILAALFLIAAVLSLHLAILSKRVSRNALGMVSGDNVLQRAREMDAAAMDLWLKVNSDLTSVLTKVPSLFSTENTESLDAVLSSLSALSDARTEDEDNAAEYLKVAEATYKTIKKSLHTAKKSGYSSFTEQQVASLKKAALSAKTTPALSEVTEFLAIPSQALAPSAITQSTSGLQKRLIA